MLSQVFSIVATLVTDSLYWNAVRYFSLSILIIFCGAFFLVSLVNLRRAVQETIQHKVIQTTDRMTIGYSTDKPSSSRPPKSIFVNSPRSASALPSPVQMSSRVPNGRISHPRLTTPEEMPGRVAIQECSLEKVAIHEYSPGRVAKQERSPKKVTLKEYEAKSTSFAPRESNRGSAVTHQSICGINREKERKIFEFRVRLVRKFGRLLAIGAVLYAAGVVLILLGGLAQIQRADEQGNSSYAENHRARSVSYRPVNDLSSYLALLCNSALQYYACMV